MKKWFYLLFLFGLFTIYGCTLTKSTSVSTEHPISSNTTTSNITSTTTTTQIQLSAVGEELRSKIYSLLSTQEQSGNIQIESVLKYTINYNSFGVDIVDYQLNEVDIFDLNNLYYYGSYSDNHSGEGWILIEPHDETNLALHVNDHGHLTLSSIDLSEDNLYKNAYNPYLYLTEMFENAVFEKQNDSSYSMTFPFKSIKDKPIYQLYFSDQLITDKDFRENGLIKIEYIFSESELIMKVSLIVLYEDKIADSLTVTLNSTLTFPESITPFTYDKADYYLDSYETIQSNMETHEIGDDIKVFSHQDRINIVKFHLDPGYYSIGSMFHPYSILETYITDSSGNRIDRNPYYKIQTSGDYYYHWEDSENINRDLKSTQLNTNQIGTIESPIISGPILTGSIDVDSEHHTNLHLLGEISPGYILKITPVTITGTLPFINNDGISATLSFDHPTYIIIDKDYTPIISVSSRGDCEYELAWEIVPFTTLETNVENMPLLPLFNSIETVDNVTTIAFLGNESIETNLKFEIIESGNYVIYIDIIDETGFLEHSNTMDSCLVYNEFGELVSGAGPSVLYQYSQGTYYLNLKWFEGEYVVITGYIVLFSD